MDCKELDNSNSIIMFYKKEESGKWLVASEVLLPTLHELTESNKQRKDGWKWHDTPPQEYEEWEQAQAEYNNYLNETK